MSSTLKNGKKTITVSPALLNSFDDIRSFVQLFPPGRLEENIWELVRIIYDKEKGEKYTPAQRSNMLCMFQLITKLCAAMQTVSKETEPLQDKVVLEIYKVEG